MRICGDASWPVPGYLWVIMGAIPQEMGRNKESPMPHASDPDFMAFQRKVPKFWHSRMFALDDWELAMLRLPN